MDPCKFCYSGVYTDPSKVYTTRGIWFQAITAPSERKVARFGCLHESVQNMEPCRSQSWPAFFRSQTWLNRSKIRPVPPVSSGTVQVFVRAKICPDPCIRGLSRSKIRPVPQVPCKRKVEPCKFFVRGKLCPDPRIRGLGFPRIRQEAHSLGFWNRWLHNSEVLKNRARNKF